MTDLLKGLSKDLIKTVRGIISEEAKTEDLSEANKENKAKSQAYRAGIKAGRADDMDTKPYRNRSESKPEYDKKKAAAVEKKDQAKDKAEKLKLSAKDRLRSLGKSSRLATTPYNKGKEVAKTGLSKGPAISGKIAHNVSAKYNDSPEQKAEYGEKYKSLAGSGENRGRFLQMHHREQHDKIRRKIDDLHDTIRNKLHDMKPGYRDSDNEGSSAIEKAKAHLEKLNKIHKAISEDTFDQDALENIIQETFNLADEVIVLEELYGDNE